MEDQLVQLLSATQTAQEGPRKQAELQLLSFYGHQELPLGLVGIACHDSVPLNIRQAALLSLKNFVLAGWSNSFDEFKGQVLVSDENKVQLRQRLLQLATTDQLDRKLKAAAGLVVSKIAIADYPNEWPDLLDNLLELIPNATDGQLHGALKVLSELVEDCFNETTFFGVAPRLVKILYDVAINEQRKPTLRALACKVFHGCFDILEMVMEDHKTTVRGFADEILKEWIPFFINVMNTRLPDPPSFLEEENDAPNAVTYKGHVAFKLQVVKVLMRIRSVFPAILSPQSLVLFQATWEELSLLQPAYSLMYIQEERQSRLEDADGLPYTLDFLVLEELDFMQACLRAPPVRAQLEQELQNQTPENSWVTQVMKLAVAYAQITTEEEGLWDIDVNIFLSEETSVTANYTPRTACGDLVIKLGEWLTEPTINGLLSYTRVLYSESKGWKAEEAALYVLNQLLSDFQDVEKQIAPEAASGYVDFIRYAMQQPDAFLRARGYLVAGSLTRTSGDALQQLATSFLEACLQAIPQDESDVVQVSCIRAMQYYLQALPHAITQPLQTNIITAISNYLAAQDLQELADSDDLMVTLVETLRDAILIDTRICITANGLDTLFQVASYQANNFQLTMMVVETFEDVTQSIAQMGGDAYIQLCTKVLPSLTGAFDVGSLTEENALCNFAADLLAVLAEHGPEPLPTGFVATTMPKLTRLLLGSTDEELLKSATIAVKNIISHDHQQLFEWRDDTGKAGLEVALIIVSRLLSSCSDHAAGEVGALAAEVVEKAGHERLGPYLEELLRSVAVRLAKAEHAQFIQSLTLVFARLSLNHASEVVEFLARQDIDGQNGLQVVLAKWLENSINFAGYDEIRQNVIALSKLYDLKDPRVAQVLVKGELIPNSDGRIMTRSRAKANPDEYTMVPAPLKILKVLVVELQSASGAPLDAAAAAELADDDSDDGDWEDEPNPFVDLGSGFSREQLMAFAAEDGPGSNRQRDDETQGFLVEFFKRAATTHGFSDEFNQLTEEEKQRLMDSAA
ncbi:ARM repeat-containing protein [Cucurbitaria berberidis CBS 394.84]|uniref:ARM repeat-containing protein n=1 Tax=Cucurbitaria berberidis CBS 394.84 TaxID=1168544 RepID=A0A9P4L3Z6_9PLEO|nr:ARM repeat-containing protein [Cucurbitaria berberidis CBS 394.84]KAF1840814.1 ARM repeat-containing protein [Cucurbitaria berberidis CBS 394.84]